MGALSDAMASILTANINALRERSGLTQELFAESIGVSQGTVARWGKGSTPKHAALESLAKFGGVSIDALTKQLLEAPAPKLINIPFTEGRLVSMPVQLPSVEELTAMFEGLLQPVKNETDRHVIARRLAQTLPNGLAQTLARMRGDGPPLGLSDTQPEDDKPQSPTSHKS